MSLDWGELTEVKKVQEQAKEIAKLLKKEGYRAGLIALGTDNTIAVNPFGNKKDTVHIIYSIIENMNEKDKLILLAMILGIDLSK